VILSQNEEFARGTHTYEIDTNSCGAPKQGDEWRGTKTITFNFVSSDQLNTDIPFFAGAYARVRENYWYGSLGFYIAFGEVGIDVAPVGNPGCGIFYRRTN
jgi:hypothetical protein